MGFIKTDIALSIQERTGVSRAKAGELADLILDVMKEVLGRGESLLVSGFGTFEVKDKKPRRGRNPQTGSQIVIDGRKVVTFKVSKVLRDRLNEA